MALLEKWTPFPVDLMDRRTRRFFEDLGFVPALTPAADIYESGDAFVVELEVPGFDEKELDIEVHDHTLSITGERKEEKELKEKTLRLHERLEARFERRFQLPRDIDSEHVDAKVAKGVLTVRVPRTEVEKAHKVEITKA